MLIRDNTHLILENLYY